jgi:small subunit ribosomal protein S4
MARYIGPKTKIARRFKDPIFGPDKSFEKRQTPPGQHGNSRRRTKLTEAKSKIYLWCIRASVFQNI